MTDRTHELEYPMEMRVGTDSLPILQSRSTINTGPTEEIILDRDWAKVAFMLPDLNYDPDEDDGANRNWSSVDNKFTDTRLGGNLGINARPQFTHYADIVVKGRLSGRKPVSLSNTGGNYGMGRFYGEAIDDNAHRIYMRFGVPQFNSLLRFFSGSFDANLTSLARTGRGLSAWYTVGNIIGTVVFVKAFPVIGSVLLIGKMLKNLFSNQTGKFYTMKPTMHLYWTAVNALVNNIAINKGLFPRSMQKEIPDQRIGDSYKPDQAYLDALHRLMPDVFNASYGYDMFATANRAQRIANQIMEDDAKRYDQTTNGNFTGIARREAQTKVTDPAGGGVTNDIIRFMEKNLDKALWGVETVKARTEPAGGIDPNTGETDLSQINTYANYLEAEFKAGAQFAIFNVESVSSVQESFSNQTTESDLSQKLNSISSDVRSARFSFADGNLTDDWVTSAITGAIGSATDYVSGIASGATGGLFDAVKGLMGSGFIDIPKHWQSSSASLPEVSYTMKLIRPYGNIISEMHNIHIPLAMIMAGGLPLSTGKASYTSPFLCQLYDRGIMQTRLGIIKNISITRGTANLPFTNRGNVTSIDVTFTVEDLSSLMHMPISTGQLFSTLEQGVRTVVGAVSAAATGGAFGAVTGPYDASSDDDNLLQDYLAVLAGMDVYSQVFELPKAKLRMAKNLRALDKITSPAYWASFTHNATTTGMLSYLIPIGHIADMIMPGSSLLNGTAGRV